MGVPVFVVTHEAPADVPEGATEFTFVDGIAVAVEQARQPTEKRDVCVMDGASVADECLRRDLLDEIQIHLAPVIMGAGVRMFDGAETERLEPISVVDAGTSSTSAIACPKRDDLPRRGWPENSLRSC